MLTSLTIAASPTESKSIARQTMSNRSLSAERITIEQRIHREALPIIRSVARKEFCFHGGAFFDRQEVEAETIVILLTEVLLPDRKKEDAIRNFPGYVKTLVQRVCQRRRERDQRERTTLSSLYAGVSSDKDEESGAIYGLFAGETTCNEPCVIACQYGLLETAWNVVCKLSAHQRIALLLHMRDARGASVIPLLVSLGIARRVELAACLGVEVSVLESLIEHLPMTDEEIAPCLGCTPREVISTRLSARRRLQRHCRTWLE